MCGRFVRHSPIDRFVALFGATGTSDIKSSYNIAPGSKILAARINSSGGRELATLKWGLVPPWSKEPKTEFSTINARAETIDQKPAYRSAFQNRRCLIPADGFYEWAKLPDGSKQPYFINLADDKPFAFAGIWERWERDGLLLDTCSIIVTESNELMRPIHDRMPVILSRDHYDAWMNPKQHETRILKNLLVPYPSKRMKAQRVSTRVNNPRNDDAELIQQG